MQTFLCYPSFTKSASVLDNRRLNKQIVECKQILMANLKGPTEVVQRMLASGDIATIHRKTPWYNHPATKIWRGHERALCDYALTCCFTALERGIKVSLAGFFHEQWAKLPITGYPPIIGHEPFHASHRSNLKRKDPIYYAVFTEEPNLPYVWTI